MPKERNAMLTLTQAAEALGVTTATLRQQIHARQLKATKMGSMWIVDEIDLATYRVQNHGRVGRPFVGRPGYVDTQHVRVRLFLAPADGRGHNSIWLQYLTESFVLDLDLTNPRAFHPTRDNFEQLDLLTGPPPGGRTFDLWNSEHVGREIGAHSSDLEVLARADPTFPAPAVTFRDGAVWDGGKVERWVAQHGPTIPAQ
jgi:excisionase family DNA binding protein